MAKIKLSQVADMAGVSFATVDRVINRRPGVRAVTTERVNDAIQTLNYRPDRLAARLAKGTEYRFGFVLPSGHNLFMQQIESELRAAVERLQAERITIQLMRTDVFDGPCLARFLEDIGNDFDGIAVVALDHPAVREAIDALVGKGVKVVTLVSDLPGSSRAHFVGIDNVAAGRTAGTLVGRFVKANAGPVALIVGSLALRDHAERKYGFEQVIRAEYPHLTVLPPMECHDQEWHTGPAVAQLIQEHPNLVAIYNVGSGNKGIIATLDSAGKPDVVFVGHEIDDSTRRALITGAMDAVINQDPGHEARSALRVLEAALEDRPIVSTQERIRIDIYLRDNMPAQAHTQG